MMDVSLSSACSSHHSTGRSTCSHDIVRSTMQDLFEVQRNTLDQVRTTVEKQKSNYVLKAKYEEIANALEYEKLDHAKTKLLLEKEREKLEFALSENEILQTRMQKDKEHYESTIKSLQSKASRETKRCDFLHQACTEVEHTIEQQQEVLRLKETEIINLKQRLKIQKENHKHKLAEIDINKMQEDYMVKTLASSQNTK